MSVVKSVFFTGAFLLLCGTTSNVAFADSSVITKAESYVGMHERKNRGSIKEVTKIDPARVPWCAAFVNGVLKQLGLSGTNSNMARSFSKYNSPTKNPQKGDIVVFNHHVGFFEGFVKKGNRTMVAVLGGNQSNRVKVSYFPVSSVISYRKV
jgi:uncharacterized protein (TIGR02594 family)